MPPVQDGWEPGRMRQSRVVLGRNVRRARTARGIPASELARRAELARATLTEIEAGRANPTLETLETLAAELGTTASDLLLATSEDRVVHVRAGEGTRKLNGVLDARLMHRTAVAETVAETWLVTVHAADEPQVAPPHPPYVVEQIYVVTGRVLAGPTRDPVEVHAGELLGFPADLSHLYRATDGDAEIVLTMIYPRPAAASGLVSRELEPP